MSFSLLSKKERQAIKEIWPLLGISLFSLWWPVFLGTLALGASIGLAAVSAWLIARASQMPPVMYLTVAVTSVRALGISKALFRYIERLVSHRIALKGVVNLRANLYEKLSGLRSDRVAGLHKGQLLGRATADVDALGDLIVRVLQPIMVAFVTAVLTCGALAFLYWPAALILLATLLFSIFGSLVLSARSNRKAVTATLLGEEKIASLTSNLLIDQAQVRALGQEEAIWAQISEVEGIHKNAINQAAKTSALGATIDNLGLALAILGCVLAGGYGVTSGTLSFVGYAVVVLTPLAAFEGTAQLPMAAAALVRSGGSAVRILELIEGPAEPESKTPLALDQTELIASDLSAAWIPGKPIFNNLSLELKPGKKIAIVGPSGIGKTTLLLCLAGMLPAEDGQLSLGGVDPWLLTDSERAKLLTLTPEDAHIFQTSVFENLRVANRDLSEEDAEKLLRQVHLGSWLDSAPAGLSTELTQGATNISGGERRRILLARALASPAPLLLLDEPAEHLDPTTADSIMRDLFSLSDRGILVVSHRLSALEDADEVIVIDKPEAGLSHAGSRDSIPATIVFRGSFEAALSDPFVSSVLEKEETHV
ncbi:thiol reductant ABC exporter subunit CydC [Boudabousia liubingyangii]|uniref:Thiol reductant ABC exporter subunit CydC n=1 Tax=Boudabousia liubingyangii TaxID=1921764 RepID=A0A1Q5PJ85_9ACTO|nr:thiol reductant ABC exporter subunit CydC [Boudabousia liubingyangii]OKL45951.1 thiol reductant ABC exporter subunit CydC [Boudabousia liubingyangii]